MISVVLPVYNESGGIRDFVQEVLQELQSKKYHFEIILVNDGSADNSFEIIKTLSEEHTQVKYINLSRNFGHQIAVSAGIDFAKGDYVVLMDSDGQDPPSEISVMFDKMQEGFDVVYAQRKTREQESFLKKATASLFYKFLAKITQIEIPINVGDFRIMNRKVVDSLKLMPEKQRYLRGQIAWLGFKQTAILYDRKGRNEGETKYTYRKMIRFAMDGITSFSNWPLRIATLTGFLCAGIGLILIFYTLYAQFISKNTVPGWSSIMITVLFIGGIQLLSIGIIGEYIGRINDNVKNRPLYLVDETNC